MNPKSTLTDKLSRIYEARERYRTRRAGRPKQKWNGREWVKVA